jgi:hypothetical protein
LSSHLTQLALAFLAGAATVFGLSFWVSGLGLDRVRQVLDGLDDHKDDIIAVFGVSVILLRSVIMPNAQWVEVINGGQLVWLVVAAGLGVALGRAGQAVKDKFQTNQPTNTGA